MCNNFNKKGNDHGINWQIPIYRWKSRMDYKYTPRLDYGGVLELALTSADPYFNLAYF
jgi:hypothetical protein